MEVLQSVTEEDGCRSFPFKTFARSWVELLFDLRDLILGDPVEVGSLWEILSNEAVGVLVKTSFPGAIWMGEIWRAIQYRIDYGVRWELLAVVKSQGVELWSMASRLCASRWKWYVSLRGSGGCISCGTGSVFVGGTSANKISSWLALQTNRCTSGLNPRINKIGFNCILILRTVF